MAGSWRRRGVLAVALVAVCAATVAGSIALDTPPPASDPDRGCADGFPRLVLLGERGFEGLVVCSNDPGTGTLIRNESAAVWLVEGAAPVHLLPVADRAASFTGLFDGASSFIPSGAAAVVAQPPDRLRLRIDARLTVAQLTHDQLLATLARRIGPESATSEPRPSVARRALLACLSAALEKVESPDCALADGRPAEVIAEAARAADSRQPSLCGLLWLEAKFNANLPSGYQTSFTADIVGWDSNEEFAARADAASVAYRSLQTQDSG